MHLTQKDKQTPWYAKALILVIVAYALSPVDLIPDFIPILGLLDDLILLPIAIYLVINLIPVQVIRDATQRAEFYKWSKERNWFGLVFILSV